MAHGTPGEPGADGGYLLRSDGPAHAHADNLIAEINRLQAQNAELLEALEAWIGHVDRFHSGDGPLGNRCVSCIVNEDEARATIDKAGKGA